VILGKQAIDDDANQTGPDAGRLWDRPQATFASKVDISIGSGADGKATVTREVDAGLETIEWTCRRWSPPTCASTSRASSSCPTS
jgi:Electron transfer flavoprotein, beta subunit